MKYTLINEKGTTVAKIEWLAPAPSPNPNPTPDPEPNPELTTRTLGSRIGACTFPWVPVDKLPFKFVRPYISADWIWRPGNKLFVEPIYRAWTQYAPGLDTYFKKCKDAGIIPVPCINQGASWFNPELDMAPAKGRRIDPASYKDYAEFFYQLAARYGKVKHNDVQVDTTQQYSNQPINQPLFGLGLLEYIEVGNEWDKWWKLPNKEAINRSPEEHQRAVDLDPNQGQYMLPEEHAALLLACYDAIKRADKNMKVVMAGLTGFDLNYLNRMWAFFKSKGRDFCADIINVHHYSNIGNKRGEWPPTWHPKGAVAPELDADFDTVRDLVQWSKNLGKELWVTEFGYDTQEGNSWQLPKTVTGQSSLEQQAYYLTRSAVEYLRLGVDQVFMFNACDEPSWQSGGLYASCGLLQAENQQFKAKLSHTLYTELAQKLNQSTVFIDESTGAVRILKHEKGYLYWSPTMENKVVSGRFGNALEKIQYADL